MIMVLGGNLCICIVQTFDCILVTYTFQSSDTDTYFLGTSKEQGNVYRSKVTCRTLAMGSLLAGQNDVTTYEHKIIIRHVEITLCETGLKHTNILQSEDEYTP